MYPSHIARIIRQFLESNFPLTEAESVPSDASLLHTGIVDSTGVLDLIEFVEHRFGVQVPDSDLLPENFDSVDNIVRYLTERIRADDAQTGS